MIGVFARRCATTDIGGWRGPSFLPKMVRMLLDQIIRNQGGEFGRLYHAFTREQ
jgi:hypothetical protein